MSIRDDIRRAIIRRVIQVAENFAMIAAVVLAAVLVGSGVVLVVMSCMPRR